MIAVTPKIGGNVFIVGSHRLFSEHYIEENESLFYKDRLKELAGDDWMEIDPKDTKIFWSGSAITCLLDPGDVLIWDSRTVHCSFREKVEKLDKVAEAARSSMNRNRFESQLGLVCTAGLVNMIPQRRSGNILNDNDDDDNGTVHRARLAAVTSSRTFTHWVDKVAPLGEERQDEVRKESYCVRYVKRKFAKDFPFIQ